MSWAMKTSFLNLFYIRPIYYRTNIHDRGKFILTDAFFFFFFSLFMGNY